MKIESEDFDNNDIIKKVIDKDGNVYYYQM